MLAIYERFDALEALKSGSSGMTGFGWISAGKNWLTLENLRGPGFSVENTKKES